MAFCKHCGAKLAEGAEFCNQCGQPVTSGVTPEPSTSIQPQAAQQTAASVAAAPTPRKPMSKKTKIGIISACIAIVVIFAAYKVGAVLTSKDRLIDKLQTALNKNDSQAIAKLLSSDDEKLKIDKNSVQGLMNYYKKHPDEVHNLIQSLKSKENSGYKGDEFISLKKDGKILFYDKYVLNIEPVYLDIQTNYKNTEIYVDGKDIGKTKKEDEEKTYGPFVPGIHSLEAKLKTSFVDLHKKDSYTLGDEGTKENIDLELDGEDVTIDLPTEEGSISKAELYIDGKDTGLNLVDNNTFGPVLTDGSMKYSIEVELPFGKIRTDEQPIDDYELTANLVTNELKQTFMDTSVSVAKEWMEAYTTGDMSKLTSATDNYKALIKDRYDFDKSENTAFKGSYLSSIFDQDFYDMYQDEGVWKADVLVKETYKSDFYDPDYESPELEDNENTWDYTLVYDVNQKKWLVDDMSSYYDLDSDNTQTVTNENPTVYTSNWVK